MRTRYLLGCLLILLAGMAQAAVRQVPGSYATIQAAVDACTTSGDTVVITTAGVYPGTVNITDKNLSVSALVPGVIVGGTISAYGQSNVDLNYLKISGTAFDGVAQAGFGDLKITSCTITANPGRGILHSSPGNVIVTSSTLSSNNFDGYNRSLGTATGGSLTINGPSVVANNGRAGILLENGASGAATINDTIVRNNNVGVWSHFAGMQVAVNNSRFLNNPQDQVLYDVKGAFSATNTTFTHTVAPSFMAGIRFDSSAAATDVSTAVISGCHFKALYPNNCLWLGHRTNLSVYDSVFEGYSSTLNVTDNGNALSTVLLSGCLMKSTTNVAVAFQGIDGNPAHTLTMTRCRLIGPSTPNNLLNAVATQAVVTNSVFEGGDAQIWSQGDQATLRAINCTMDGDSHTTTAVNFINGSPQHLVANCIINNTRLGISATTVGLTIANHHNLIRTHGAALSNVTTGTATLLNVDPKFVADSTGPGTGNYDLRGDSPAVDHGDSSLGIITDFDILPRDTNVDIGAYELQVNSARRWQLYL